MSGSWPWLTLALLGAYHGLNPGMGWLFAVARGLQDQRRGAVLRSLGPIAIGHAASIALVVALVGGVQTLVAPGPVRAVGAVVLILFGVFKLLRPRSHPRWVGMRIGAGELALWSFLMATAHGAGLMLFPVLLALPAAAQGTHAGGHAHGAAGALGQDAGAVLVHTLAMLLVMGAVALVVYEKVGLAILRRAWINLDLVWAVAIVAAGAFTLFT
ncbi:MAG: hypothetical protein ACJ79H_22610 [Myxococcales bacterium]